MERTGTVLHRLEPWLFLALVLLHTLPLFGGIWFVTLDGPSHLNNARIMSDLLLGHGRMHEFFQLNPYPEPNMLGHVIMALVMFIAPAWIAEKLVLLLAVVGLAYAFRALMRAIAPDKPWAPLLAMPFLMGFPFFMGFINFCLSLPLLLWTLAAWERALQRGEVRKLWGLVAVLLLLYLAHLATFLVCVGLIAARTGWAWWMKERELRAGMRSIILSALTASSVPLLLTVGYFTLHHGHAAAPASHAVGELLKWTIEGRAWVTFASGPEVPWTMTIAILLLALATTGVIARIAQGKQVRSAGLFWIAAALWMFACYLVLPDTMAGGSFTSGRLLLFTMILLGCWVAVSPTPKGVLGAGMAIVVLADLGHLNAQASIERSLQREADDLVQVAESLKQGDVVLPLNYSGNWMHSNFSSYLGAASGAVVLDNFVATAPFSPVRWREARLPYNTIGNFDRSDRPCVHIDAYRDGRGSVLVTHVLTFHLFDDVTDSCTNDLRRQLSAGFRPVAISPSGDARLYARN